MITYDYLYSEGRLYTSASAARSHGGVPKNAILLIRRRIDE